MRFFDFKQQPPAIKYYEEDDICNTSLEPDPGHFDVIWKQYTPIPTNKALDRQIVQANVLSENLRKDRRSYDNALQKQKGNTNKLHQISEQLQKLRKQSPHHNDIPELERQMRELNRENDKLEPYIKQLRELIATRERLIIQAQGTLENPTYAKYYQSCS